MNRSPVKSDFAVDKVERALLHGILTGCYRANDFLPSADRLCATFGLAYQTVRSAVGRLVSRGLVETVPGGGRRVVDLQSSIDLRLLLEVIAEADAEPNRKWNLCAQLAGFLRFLLAEVADRAARNHDDTQLEWLRHYARLLADRVALNTSRSEVGEAELQLTRVLAAASGCVTHTAIINSMRSLFLSQLLVVDCASVVPVDDYLALVDAIEKKDSPRARALADAAWWRVEERCIEELKKLGWSETPSGAAPASP